MSDEFVILKATASDGGIESVTFSGAMKDELTLSGHSYFTRGLCVLFIEFKGGSFNAIVPPELEVKIEKNLIVNGAVFKATTSN